MEYYEQAPESEWLLAEMLADYRDMVAKLKPALAEMNDLKKAIQQHVIETGEVGEVEGCKVSIRKGYTRMSWNGKGLQGYAVANPEVLAFATEKEVKASAVIKVT